MTISIGSPKEAFVAIASVVIAADSLGSVAERDAVLGRLREIPACAGSDAELKALLARVTQHLCDGLPMTDSGSFTTAAVAQVIVAVKPVLDAAQRGDAVRLAEATMSSDGASSAERALIDQLRTGLTG